MPEIDKNQSDDIVSDINQFSARARIAAKLNTAKVCYQQKKYEDAEQMAREIVSTDNLNSDAYYILGLVARQRRQYQEAVEFMNEAIRLSPDRPDYHFTKGMNYTDLERAEDALLAYDMAVLLAPEFAEAHNFRANILGKAGRFNEALRACEKVIEIVPNSAQAYSNLGNILYKIGQIEGALEAYNAALAINPELADTHYNQGLVYNSVERYEDARESFRNALRINPKLESAGYMLAALDGEAAPAQPPAQYVTSLFDGYAVNYDEILVEKLNCQVPKLMLMEGIKQLPDKSVKLDILDLGCGTGLCGVAFRDLATTLVGIDLSSGMLAKSGEREIYTELLQGDILTVLENTEQQFDLVLSGDVFVYIGALDGVFSRVRKCLKTGGLFIFSVEREEGHEKYKIRKSGRYAHSPEYIKTLTVNTGFSMVSNNSATLRNEHGKPVAGEIILLRARDNTQ